VSEEERLFSGIEYSAPHRAKLAGLLKNKKLPPSDKQRVQEALGRYEDWVAAMRSLDSEGDERVEELVRLMNDYKRYVELEVIWDSDHEFLFRQRGQLKIDNSIIEEFLPYLADERMVPDLKDTEYVSGPYKTFSSAYFTATLTNAAKGGGLETRTKDQDFTVGRTAHLRASFDPAFPPAATVTERIYLAFVAAECKTNLDKTMFQEAVSTARDIRTAIPGSRYYLLCEWLDMTPISTESTDISEAIILRGRRLGADQRSGLADPETRRERRDWYERFLAEHPIRDDRILRFVGHLRTLFKPAEVDEGSVAYYERARSLQR